MRSLVSLVVIVSFCIPAFLNAEGEKKEPRAQEKAAGEKKMQPACKRSEIAGLVLEVCVPEKNIAGAPFACTIKVTNTANGAITYVFTTSVRMFVLEIKDLKGTPIPYTRFGKSVFEGEDTRFLERTLAPGQSILLQYDLTRYFDLTIADDYSLSVVSRQNWMKDKKISVDALKFSVKDR
jgi:hypothetical protein